MNHPGILLIHRGRTLNRTQHTLCVSVQQWLGPRLVSLKGWGGSNTQNRSHLQVSSLMCLVVDTCCWLRWQLGCWPEHLHMASLCGLFAWATLGIFTEWQMNSKSEHPKRAGWKLAWKNFWYYFHQSHTSLLGFKRWEHEPHVLIEGMSKLHCNISLWDNRCCWQHPEKTQSPIVHFSLANSCWWCAEEKFWLSHMRVKGSTGFQTAVTSYRILYFLQETLWFPSFPIPRRWLVLFCKYFDHLLELAEYKASQNSNW